MACRVLVLFHVPAGDETLHRANRGACAQRRAVGTQALFLNQQVGCRGSCQPDGSATGTSVCRQRARKATGPGMTAHRVAQCGCRVRAGCSQPALSSATPALGPGCARLSPSEPHEQPQGTLGRAWGQSHSHTWCCGVDSSGSWACQLFSLHLGVYRVANSQILLCFHWGNRSRN